MPAVALPPALQGRSYSWGSDEDGFRGSQSTRYSHITAHRLDDIDTIATAHRPA
ncbi:hypothetical protein [Terriglobus roseus]|uniref:hypothetical protein n=1 Tax=Terriglobus roseus TaxID=392734 RepID=UPI001BAFC7EC|nr:hypothetical protein [Terriglobus roseus]